MFVGFPGVPQVDLGAFHADGLRGTPIGGEDLPVQDHVGHALSLGAFQGFVHVRGLIGKNTDDLVHIPVEAVARDVP